MGTPKHSQQEILSIPLPQDLTAPPFLSRPRLLELLDRCLQRRLVLICAGPGFGKTSLLADFARQTNSPICWHTLTPADRERSMLLSHLIEAAQSHWACFGEPVLPHIESGYLAGVSLHKATAELGRESGKVAENHILVMDNIHFVLNSPQFAEALEILLSCLPARAHLILAGRSLPALLPRHLLATDGIGLLHTEKLRFTPEEMVALFKQHLELPVGEEGARMLAQESEGWIQGALLQARACWEGGSLAADRISHCQVLLADYFRKKVLSLCSTELLAFLRQVCCFSKMNAALCNTLTGRQDASTLLGVLQQNALFLVPLGEGWYRFEHLFRSFLIEEVLRQGGDFLALMRRAEQLEAEHSRPAAVTESFSEGQPGSRMSTKLVLPASSSPIRNVQSRGECGSLCGSANEEVSAMGMVKTSPSEERRKPNSEPPATLGQVLELLKGERQHHPWLNCSTLPRNSSGLHILAFGPGQVFCKGEEILVSDWRYRLVQELFFYLVFHVPVEKEQIGLVFWPERRGADLNKCFHTTLYNARRALGSPHFVTFHKGRYVWNPEISCSCDAFEFEKLLDLARHQVPEDPLAAISTQEQAIALYRGDFLARFNSDWCTARRDQLASQYLQTLLVLGKFFLRQQNYAKAQLYYEKALGVDEFSEEACQGLLSCCALQGNRITALQIYRRFCQHLWRELRAAPSERINELNEKIRLGTLHSSEDCGLL